MSRNAFAAGGIESQQLITTAGTVESAVVCLMFQNVSRDQTSGSGLRRLKRNEKGTND
jgi:hypothetical protein